MYYNGQSASKQRHSSFSPHFTSPDCRLNPMVLRRPKAMPTSNETTPKSKESTSMGCGSIFQCIRNSFSSSKKIHKNDYQSIPRLFPPPPPEVRPNHFSNMIMPSFPGDNGDDTTWAAVEITNGMSDEVYSCLLYTSPSPRD